MSDDFDGKVALVTGAGSGMGMSTALAFANKKAKVIVNDVNVESGQKTVQMIKEAGSEAIFVHADVTKASEVQALLNKGIEAYGRLDFAFNNAGIEGELTLTADCTEENWDRVIAIDLKGVWLCMKYEIMYMVKHGGGAIVNTSSVEGLVGFMAMPAYVAAKHGVIGLTKAAALEYARSNIRINAVCPGPIETPLLKRVSDINTKWIDNIVKRTMIGRKGKAEEVAAAVLWLCSDAASYITGHALAVDGGYVSQ